ncbi:MAG: HlyD family type I secretion periplasmic adaptor subunit [Epsilonproteobacteria bacterium]|nr:HlyD family type I secretion periplasmic adaptor subunit [Campylobacterota bacterium]
MGHIEDIEESKMPSSNTAPAIMFGLTVVFLVFGVIGGWMYYAPLDSSSVAIGSVSAGSAKKTVEHLDGGIIKKIYVKDGDSVEKGDILIELEDIQLKETLNSLESQYQDALALLNRLEAQRDNRDSIEFSKDIKDKTLIDTQNSIFYTTKKSLRDEDIITQKRIVQIKKQIKSLEALIDSRERRLFIVQKEKREQRELFDEQLVDKIRLQELEKEESDIEGEIASKLADIARLREQISELKTQQLLRKKQFKEEVLENIVQTKIKIEDLKSRIVSTKDKLERTKILAPTSGIIVGLKKHTVGGVIGRGEEILEIVPKDSKLLVLARVNTTDIDRVKIGQYADLMFPAFNMRIVHIIEGKVIGVSADIFEDKATREQYYEAKIELTKNGEDELKRNGFILISGMPATVMIKLERRTTLEYLIKPFKDMVIKGFNEE